MKRKSFNFVALFVFGCVTLLFVGCSGGNGGGNNQDPNRGFDVQILANNIPTVARVSGVFLNGSGTFGSVTTFNNVETSGVGYTQIVNAKVPGTWRLTYGPSIFGGSLCLGVATEDQSANLGSLVRLNCVPRFYGFTASPETIDALNPPATISFSGKGIENLVGTPVLAYYDEFGNVVASSTSNQLLYSNGEPESVSANVPNLSLVYDGVYTVAIHNINPNGTWELIGAATMTVYGNPPPPPTGGGGDDCDPSFPNLQQLPCNQS